MGPEPPEGPVQLAGLSLQKVQISVRSTPVILTKTQNSPCGHAGVEQPADDIPASSQKDVNPS